MDNFDYEKGAISDYRVGWRAYQMNGNMVLMSPSGVKNDVSNSGKKYAILFNQWQALRAYQDAERKKGVPIGPEYFSHEKNYETIDCHFEFRRGGLSGDGRPYINVFALKNMYSVHCHAKFTNFRWRAGYPKEKTAIQLAREAVDKPGVHWPGYPKGGQNG